MSLGIGNGKAPSLWTVDLCIFAKENKEMQINTMMYVRNINENKHRHLILTHATCELEEHPHEGEKE